jgi:purine-nucleoside phosphorylase
MLDTAAEMLRQVEAAAATVRARLAPCATTALVLGSGLGDLAEALPAAAALDYAEIPHHPVATVEGHRGRLLHGEWQGRPLLVLQGRFHLYEGYTAREIAFPIRVLAALGVRNLLLTNAAGSLNPAWRPGELMLLRDHLNLTGQNPLAGPNPERWGPRFPALAEPYSRALGELARATAAAAGLRLHEGVYACVAGPSLETAAETRALRLLGADAVGMSTVPETITAVHAGLRVLALSVLTNSNDPAAYAAATHAEILAAAAAAAPRLSALLAGVVARLEP